MAVEISDESHYSQSGRPGCFSHCMTQLLYDSMIQNFREIVLTEFRREGYGAENDITHFTCVNMSKYLLNIRNNKRKL